MDFTTPTWEQLGDKQREIDELHAENALKLKQILDLEQIIWDLRLKFLWKDKDKTDTNPCWCGEWDEDGGLSYPMNHSHECIKARKATEPFWKK